MGSRYQLEGNAGGTIERCDPPRSFAATWEYGGEVSWIASLAAGTDRAVARAAATRTTAFYTGTNTEVPTAGSAGP